MKNFNKITVLAIFLFSFPVFAIDGVAVIDMRTAILSTQVAQEAFKAMAEDEDYATNLEQAKSLEASRQSTAEKLQKEAETLSQEEIIDLQKEFQEQGKDLEFIAGKLQQAQQDTVNKVLAENAQTMQKIVGELIQAKQIQVLLAQSESIIFSDPALNITDDVTSMLDIALSDTSTQSE
ncbi:MAG: OmpH family outer membrane protein [SAR86 cluster bacterium]|jgi:Skp family chaperone for outer membrane proteins|nr:MAG: OmpH family outer membrane protein [SAR86 cluster bacterium]|tara:strand:+ start:98 stop:634 length:537 start_codon:yes stop_codon:yes gene_type:complete